MTIDELIQGLEAKQIMALLKQGKEDANLELYQKAVDIEKHKVNDTRERPNKLVKVEDGDRTYTRLEKVNRIALAIQKLIINRSVAFLFGNKVAYNFKTSSEQDISTLKATFNRLLDLNKIQTKDRQIARTVMTYTECAELWYLQRQDETNFDFGLETAFKLKHALFTPQNGDKLYPYFDEYGDMTAFSRQYTKVLAGSKLSIFETYTKSFTYKWQEERGELRLCEGYPKPNPLKKIPIIYIKQDEHETANVDKLIDRLELLLSNFADTNDYHASPKIFVRGELLGFSKKGESGAILQGTENTSVEYLSWQNAPESVKLEIETLLKMIFTITQTPNISFDEVKGLGAISGVALKLLFMDAHLKVEDKEEIFGDFLQRRANIVLSLIGLVNDELGNLRKQTYINPKITPYIIKNEKEELDYWLSATGNKPLISQEEAIEKVGITSSPTKTLELLKKETALEEYKDTFEPTI